MRWHQRIGRSVKSYVASFSFVGLVLALLSFLASVTPSLLPRTYVVQGILSGFAIASGYALGVFLSLVYRFFELPELAGASRKRMGSIAAVLSVLSTYFILNRMTLWQNSIRDLMEMPPIESAYPMTAAMIATITAGILLAIGRLLLNCSLWVSNRVRRVMPRRLALAFGFLFVSSSAFVIGNGVIARTLVDIADANFLALDTKTDEGIEKPTTAERCGGEQSLVDWESVGRRGKNFLEGGPTLAEIQAFHDRVEPKAGVVGKQPIRVYVGQRTRETVIERAELALQELIRVGGFERSVLVVATPTGTGWLDPGAVDTIEYLHAGDTAIVSTQYSHLPSWITILVDPTRSIRSATALFEVVYDHWSTLPRDSRPKLYLFGLSLGALGSEVSTSLYRIFEDPSQGAVWSGPPFPSTQWARITAARNEGSPAWLPRFEDGRLIRFTAQKNSLNDGRDWGPIRNVYLQYASDPMVFFSTDLMWKRPGWLNQGRGPDVSPHLRWYPVVTFLQIAFDLPMSTSVPLGYGHNYSPKNYIDAWIAVTDPPRWDAEKTRLLKLRFAD